MIAVGRDPNDQYLPLAFVVVENETENSWKWFLELLVADIGEIDANKPLYTCNFIWTCLLDTNKFILSIARIGSNTWSIGAGEENRFCLRHLYQNFKNFFGGGTLLRDLMMGAAKATYVQAHDWVMTTVDKNAWCKHAFSRYPKCDLLMNNLSEAFNSTILVAREKPIITLFEWIRSYLMARFVTQ